MGLNERFLENEQNISALKIHRTGISGKRPIVGV